MGNRWDKKKAEEKAGIVSRVMANVKEITKYSQVPREEQRWEAIVIFKPRGA